MLTVFWVSGIKCKQRSNALAKVERSPSRGMAASRLAHQTSNKGEGFCCIVERLLQCHHDILSRQNDA